jgi:DNA repair photolyase
MSVLPLLPDQDEHASKPLVGIAKLAAAGDSIREGHDVEYFTLSARSILNRCDVKRLPFRWTVNPYRGCEFACKYCYARYTHEFMEIRDNVEFERKIYVKQHAAWLLRQELHQVKTGEPIAIGTATDPYQPAERRYEVTRALLEEFANHDGLQIGIATKSDLVLRDTDVLRRTAKHNQVHVSLTVTTVDTKLARILEPRAPRPDLRLGAVRQLNDAGIEAGVLCAPVIPGITDSPRQLEDLVRAAARAGAIGIFANPLFLKPCSASIFLPFLEKEFPALVESYRERYGEHSFVDAGYRQRISRLMNALTAKYGISSEQRSRQHHAEAGRSAPNKTGPHKKELAAPQQISLFEAA